MSVLKTIKFYTKSAVFATLIAGCGLYGVIASIVLTVFGKKHLAQWTVARAFYYSFSSVLNVKIELLHEERLNNLPAIIIGNHQSALDILILGRVFPKGCVVTSKKSLQYIPVLGWFMSLSGTFFIDRSKKEKAKAVLNKALDNMKKKERAVFIFPEGTRSGSESLDMLEFKKGAFHLAVQGKIPIIPIVVSNTSPIFNAKTKEFNAGKITIEVLPPISVTDLTSEDVNSLTTKTRSDMVASLKKIGFSYVPGQEPPVEIDSDESEGETSAIETTELLASAK